MTNVSFPRQTQAVFIRALIPLVLILIGGLALRLAVFDRFLPAQDYTDESAYYILVQHEIGYPDAAYLPPGRFSTWTPVYVYGSELVLRLSDWLRPTDWLLPSEHFFALRLASVFLSTITLACVMWAGWLVGRLPAAIAVGLVWGLSPWIVDIDTLGLPDVYAFTFTAAAVATGICAWKKNSPRWLMASLITGMLAIFSKYPTAMAIVPFCVTALVMLIKEPRRMRMWLVAYGVVAAIGIIYLFIVVNPFAATDGHREMTTFKARVYHCCWISRAHGAMRALPCTPLAGSRWHSA